MRIDPGLESSLRSQLREKSLKYVAILRLIKTGAYQYIYIPYSRKYRRGTNFGKLAICQRIANIKSAKFSFWVRFHKRVVS